MRLKRYLLPTVLALGVTAFVIAPTVLAAGDFGLNAAAGNTIPKTQDLAQLIGKILGAALGFVGTLFLLLMIYGGFKWMTARGEEKHVKEAKDLIMGAVIGMVIIAGAYALTSFVITAITSATTQSSSSSDGGSGGTGGGASSCTTRSCHTASDCSQGPGEDLCYVGTCECIGASDPTYGAGSTPCTEGFCTEL